MAKANLSITLLAIVFFLSACGPRQVGPRVAFSSDRDGDWEIYVMNADGSGQINLTNEPSSDRLPSCSPDGARIAFTSARDGNSEIYLMNADGSGVTRRTEEPVDDGGPEWCQR